MLEVRRTEPGSRSGADPAERRGGAGRVFFTAIPLSAQPHPSANKGTKQNIVGPSVVVRKHIDVLGSPSPAVRHAQRRDTTHLCVSFIRCLELRARWIALGHTMFPLIGFNVVVAGLDNVGIGLPEQAPLLGVVEHERAIVADGA